MDVLILANSRKLGGRCVAGIDLDSRKWVRPVARSGHGELSKQDCLISDNGTLRDVEVLDVISVPIGKPIDALGQPENCVLLSDAWSLKRKISINQAGQVLDPVCDDDTALLCGIGRSVSMELVRGGLVKKSLTLIKVLKPDFYIDESKKLRCRFIHSDNDYDLPITDDSQWVKTAKSDPVLFSVGNWYFTISLGEPFKGQMWKLIAAGIRMNSS